MDKEMIICLATDDEMTSWYDGWYECGGGDYISRCELCEYAIVITTA